MKKNSRPEDDFLVSFSDLKRICSRKRKQIISVMIFFGCLGLLYALTKSVTYSSEATFREKGKSQAAMGKSLSDLLLGGASTSHESEAMSLMKSRRLKDLLVRRLGLQAHLEEKNSHPPLLSRIWNNIKIDYAHLRKYRRPLFEQSNHLICQSVEYAGEIPIALELVFHTDDAFSVRDSFKKKVGDGKVGTLFKTENYSFLLSCPGEPKLKNQTYVLNLSPLFDVANILKSTIKVTADKNDKSLLILKYSHPNRQESARFLNELMNSYQGFLQEEHDRNSNTQLTYLKKRQKETLQDYELFMQGYAAELADDLQNTGLLDAEKEMQFLLETQRRYLQKIHSNDLTSMRLESILENETIYFDPNITEGSASSVTNLFQVMDELKQQSVALNLALQQHLTKDHQGFEGLLAKQAESLQVVNQKIQEIKIVIDSLNRNVPIDPALIILHDPNLIVGTWCALLDETAKSKDKEGVAKQKETCLAYLENLLRLLEIQERTLKERLSYEYGSLVPFHGVTLESANLLYRDFINQSHKLESEIREHVFTYEQLADEDFEIFSLISVLHDPVSQDIISKSGALALQLRDQENRSSKELERIKNELDMQKHFLKVHLAQTIKLLELRSQLLQEKIHELQVELLELVHQKISIIQQHIREWISSRLTGIQQEKELLEKQLGSLNQQMAKLPKKWVAEQLIKQNLFLNKAVIEEITRLVEGKNIANNLEIIQSAPLDFAPVPLLPDSPKIILFAFLGAALGGFFSLGFFMLKTMFNGVDASSENLRNAHQNVAGVLSWDCCGDIEKPLFDEDLETLRRLMAFFQENFSMHNESSKNSGQVALLIEGKGPDYAKNLAGLMSKKGWKVLVLPLSFDSLATHSELPGLLDYLEGSAEFPKINPGKEFDTIAAAGISRFSGELICSQRFHVLLEKLREKYDMILAVSHALPVSAEATTLVETFDILAVTVVNEKLQDFVFYIQLSKKMGKKVIFTLAVDKE